MLLKCQWLIFYVGNDVPCVKVWSCVEFDGTLVATTWGPDDLYWMVNAIPGDRLKMKGMHHLT